MKNIVVLLIALIALVGCSRNSDDGPLSSGGSEPSPTYPLPTPPFAEGRALLAGDDGSTLIDLEIAETDQQRQQGLMYRTELAEDEGMLFIFFEETNGGFWMKNTLIPLSIAYLDAEGTILKILDMEPCEADPCPSYPPGVLYSAALEVNQGAFDSWGVGEGDSVRIIQDNRNNL